MSRGIYRKIQRLLRRIGTLNCGHAAFPIILGVNEPQYSSSELEQFRQENEKGIDYEGQHFTMYEATQRQRELERAIRKRKRKILVGKSAGLEEQVAVDQTRLVVLNREYARFSKAAGLKTQRERMNVPGFGRKDYRQGKNTIAKNAKVSYNNIQKLPYSGSVTPELEEAFETSLSRMPQRHREIAEQKVKGIIFTDSRTGSFYSRRTGNIHLSRFSNPDTAIHEYAHALAEALNVYDDPVYQAILRKGFENIGPEDIIYDEDNFVEPIYRVENSKFVSLYQGRLYEEVGIFNGSEISLNGMLDYFSEGYEEYIRNPDNLKAHDPELYSYFEGIT